MKKQMMAILATMILAMGAQGVADAAAIPMMGVGNPSVVLLDEEVGDAGDDEDARVADDGDDADAADADADADGADDAE